MREAGATAVQELAFTLANAIAYCDHAVAAGLKIDQFAPRLAFFFDSHNELFEEVAKFRAARRMWAKITRERYGATNPRSWMLRFHTQTAGVSLQAQQIENNVVRVAIQALAAILGGTQSLHTNARDEALALPTEESAKLALRTQQVLAYESGVADVVDPLAGSYFVESLTEQTEAAAWRYIEQIDASGRGAAGDRAGVHPGRDPGERLPLPAGGRARRPRDRRRQPLRGRRRRRPTADILRVDPAVRDRQIARIQAVKARRDEAEAQAALAALESAARGTENTMPRILACVEALCTLGEISDTLRAVFGEAGELSAL